MEILIIFAIILLIYASIKDDIRDFEIVKENSYYVVIYKVKFLGFTVSTKTIELYDVLGFPEIAKFATENQAYAFIYKIIKDEEDEHSLY